MTIELQEGLQSLKFRIHNQEEWVVASVMVAGDWHQLAKVTREAYEDDDVREVFLLLATFVLEAQSGCEILDVDDEDDGARH
jgi:hypothetical protein